MEVAAEFCGLAGNTRGEEVDEPGEEADMPGEEEDMGLLLSAFPGERAAASAGLWLFLGASHLLFFFTLSISSTCLA